jgi:hypothetical protein
MSPEDFATKMAEVVEKYGNDPELVHCYSDDLMIQALREAGFGAGIDVRDTIETMWWA